MFLATYWKQLSTLRNPFYGAHKCRCSTQYCFYQHFSIVMHLYWFNYINEELLFFADNCFLSFSEMSYNLFFCAYYKKSTPPVHLSAINNYSNKRKRNKKNNKRLSKNSEKYRQAGASLMSFVTNFYNINFYVSIEKKTQNCKFEQKSFKSLHLRIMVLKWTPESRLDFDNWSNTSLCRYLFRMNEII